LISVEQARALYTEGDAAHRFDHVLRVTALAVKIAQAEGADVEIVRAAALLHDIGLDKGRERHEVIAARRAYQILAGQPREKVEAVAQAIRSHRFRAGPPPQTLEAKCLFDADKLDAIGAIGVARAFAFGGAAGQRLWANVPQGYDERERNAGGEHTPIHEFVVKLSKIKDRLTTETGRRIGETRHNFMVAFFAQLEAEVDGEAQDSVFSSPGKL
jgi:uncharacterized protein